MNKDKIIQSSSKHVIWLLKLLTNLGVDIEHLSHIQVEILMAEEFIHGYKHGWEDGTYEAKRSNNEI